MNVHVPLHVVIHSSTCTYVDECLVFYDNRYVRMQLMYMYSSIHNSEHHHRLLPASQSVTSLDM